MRPTGQKCRAMHDAQRRIPCGDQAGLLRELPARAFEWVLAAVERPRRHLPRRRLPCMAPLADQHRVAVVEPWNDESGIRIRDHRIQRFCAVRKSDHVVAELELARYAAHGRARDLEGPARFGMPQRSYRRTIEATAAAAAAT